MNIVITQSVTDAATLFQDLGNIRFVADADLIHTDVNHVDAIIMRSQSRVSVEQLKDSCVRFIGTATAGDDHLPVDDLKALGIHVANAPACNAHSVADYWLSAMLSLHDSFEGKTLGLIGYGAVGQCVAQVAKALGLRVIVNDPPRLSLQLPIPFETFALPELLSQADIISLHVPLVSTGPWPTRKLIQETVLTHLKPGAVWINTARGEVCDAKALTLAKAKGLISHLIVDVWPREPFIDNALWQAATIATPHIAGHAYSAKWQGTWQIYQCLLQYLGKPLEKSREALLPPGLQMKLMAAQMPCSEQEGLWHYVRQVYDVTKDHQTMQSWLALSPDKQPVNFTAYRSHYPWRSELRFAVLDKTQLTPWQHEVFLSLGSTIV